MNDIIKNLNVFLADLNVFYRKVQNYHWNIKGKNFFVIHEKLEEYYDSLNEQIDEIAEHILILGGQPLGTLKDYLQISNIAEAENKKVNEDEVFENVLKGFEDLLGIATKIKEDSESANLYATSSLIDNYILDYSKKIWMLKQLKQA